MTSLTLLVFLPLLGALLIALTPKNAVGLQRLIALGTTLAVAVMGLVVCTGFQGASAAAQYVVDEPWFFLPGPGAATPVHFKLGLDGLSVLMVGLTALLGPIVVLSTYGHIQERVKEFMIWLLVMQTGMLGVFLALDLVLFYFFWEVSLVPLYFILGIWGHERRLYATIKFFLYTLAGSLVMMVGVIALIYALGTADIERLTQVATSLPLAQQGWYFAAFALAFMIKVPVMPFHTWLPDAHTEAPASGSVVLAAVLLKMGTYGLLRFCIAMFPAAALDAAPWMMALGVLGIVYGAFLAMAQSDLKRLVACSSISHLGYVVVGLFAMTQAGLRGGMLQMVNHGLSTGLLFLLIGMIYERRHTRALDQYGGIAAVMPVFSLFFTIAVLSSVGLPGLNGFVGEYLILLGTFQAKPWFATVAVTGVIFGAVYLLMATRRLLYGPVIHAQNKTLSDLGTREVALMVPVVILIVWIGVAPNVFLDRSAGSINALMERIDTVRGVRMAEAAANKQAELALIGTAGRPMQPLATDAATDSSLADSPPMNHDLIARLLDGEAIQAIAPILALTGGVILLLLADILPGLTILRRPVFLLSILIAAAFEVHLTRAVPYLAFESSFAAGPITAAWGLLFLASALIAWAFAQRYYREENAFQMEHDVLLLSSVMGMMLMAGAQDLLVFFIGLELLSVPLYTLAAFRRARTESVEAGLKYFVLGAFAAGIFLFGTALLYAGSGSISLVELRTIGVHGPIALTGVALLAASLFFKISVFPFHLWVPDVYQGSPTPVTALMATGTKAAGFAFLLNASFLLPTSASAMVALIAVLTMAAGNFGALMQTDVKRMLAYSGVAHAGTLLLAVAGDLAGDPARNGAVHAALFYMGAYVFTAGGAFGLVALLEAEGKAVTIDSLRGLAKTRPGVAAAMALFMLSLGGIPATGGFLGKYLVFSVAVRADMIPVAVIGVLLSVVALGYYLRVVVAMYMQSPSDETKTVAPSRYASLFATAACAAMVILLGVLPGWFLSRMG